MNKLELLINNNITIATTTTCTCTIAIAIDHPCLDFTTHIQSTHRLG
jgi:hypothetical protein